MVALHGFLSLFAFQDFFFIWRAESWSEHVASEIFFIVFLIIVNEH